MLARAPFLPSGRMLAGAGIAVLPHVLLWQLLQRDSMPAPPVPAQRITQLVFIAPASPPARPMAPAAATRQLAPRKTFASAPAHVGTPVQVPAAATELAMPVPVALDMDALKRQAREIARHDAPSAAGSALTAGDRTAQAIASAARPKCDNDYKPRVGNVEFTGLAKLPFLLKGATGDSGCKW